jgi:hypothetical protein
MKDFLKPQAPSPYCPHRPCAAWPIDSGTGCLMRSVSRSIGPHECPNEKGNLENVSGYANRRTCVGVERMGG